MLVLPLNVQTNFISVLLRSKRSRKTVLETFSRVDNTLVPEATLRGLDKGGLASGDLPLGSHGVTCAHPSAVQIRSNGTDWPK